MSGANQAKLKIVESDSALEALLNDISPVVVMLSVVHMTGKLDIIRGAIKPKPNAFNSDSGGSLTPEEAAAVRAQALTAIKAWRDAGCPPPCQPTDDELHEMFNFLVGVEMPSEYLTMMLTEIGYHGDDRRGVQWRQPVADAVKREYPVLIAGGGMSGLAMAYLLKKAGIPFTVIEKNQSVGGTWHENRYPGLRVDVPSHCYSYSFMQDHKWPHRFSFQRDLQNYFTECVRRFGFEPHIRYGREVVAAAYDEQSCLWDVTLRAADGAEERVTARALVTAVGLLNRPAIPDFPGAKTFRGESFHTSRWRHEAPLEGKKIIVVGNAATALQAVPELAKVASKLSVFQRSPGWTNVNPAINLEVTKAEHWAFDHLPYYAGWMRARIFNWPFDRTPGHMKIDPAWPQDGLSVSAANHAARLRMLGQLHEHLGDRPDLIEKLTPQYPPYIKRPTYGNGGYYQALRRDNVELVVDGIERIVENGIIDKKGRLHEADVIVYATGFQAQSFLAPMRIKGRGGVDLHEKWGDSPGGYLGIAVPDFPNFFVIYGPNTNLGYNGNVIFNSECQAHFIADCLRLMIERGWKSIEVRREVAEAYIRRTQQKLKEFVWSTPYGSSYFRNAKGEVTTNTPWSLLEYWTWTRKADPSDFIGEEASSERVAVDATEERPPR